MLARILRRNPNPGDAKLAAAAFEAALLRAEQRLATGMSARTSVSFWLHLPVQPNWWRLIFAGARKYETPLMKWFSKALLTERRKRA